MKDNFSLPKTRQEFLERTKEIKLVGARVVAQGLSNKIDRVAGAMMVEKSFFDEIIAYHETGKVPERYLEDGQTT